MPDYKLTRRDVMRLGACAAAGALLPACTPAVAPRAAPLDERQGGMRIGIVVYSQTGHTLLVAQRLAEKLSATGHIVTLERVETIGEVSPTDTSVALRTSPAIDGYDAIVFGSPVWGGRPASPTVSYLEQIPSLQDRRVAILVTGAFPANWGRNQTIARMTELCEAKGAMVIGSGSVGWFSLRRQRHIADAVDSLSRWLATA